MKTTDFQVLEAAWDYATLTSTDKELTYVGRDLVEWEHGSSAKGMSSSSIGYRGTKIDGMFYGSKRQKIHGQLMLHHMVQLWGSKTKERVMVFLDHVDEVRCTRADVQVTVATTSAEPLRLTYDKAKAEGLNVALMESSTSTVTFGSRKSQRYSRLYEKIGKNAYPYRRARNLGEEWRIIRFEVEYKDILADKALDQIRWEDDDPLLLVMGEMNNKAVGTEMSNGIFVAMVAAAQADEGYRLKGHRKPSDPYVFFTETILPWLLNRRDKLTGDELYNCEQWVQAHFEMD